MKQPVDPLKVLNGRLAVRQSHAAGVESLHACP
jgi:hypothetical protein